MKHSRGLVRVSVRPNDFLGKWPFERETLSLERRWPYLERRTQIGEHCPAGISAGDEAVEHDRPPVPDERDKAADSRDPEPS